MTFKYLRFCMYAAPECGHGKFWENFDPPEDINAKCVGVGFAGHLKIHEEILMFLYEAPGLTTQGAKWFNVPKKRQMSHYVPT